MITVNDEDAKLFEQNGFSQEDVGNTVNHYREQGLSDDDIQKKINFKIGMMRNPEGVTPYMQVANDPNLTPNEKVFKINAIKTNDDYVNSVDNLNRQMGAEGLRKAEQFEQQHPIVSDVIRPWLEAYKSDSQELAMMGKRTPLGYLKRGTMGGLGGLSVGSIPYSMGAKTVLNPFTANMIKGAASFAAPTAGYMASEVMNNEKTGQELAQETTKNAVLGAAMSGVGSVASAPVRAATMNQLAKPIENRLALKALKYNRNVSDEGIKKAARNLLQKDLSKKTLGSSLKAGLYEAPASAVGGVADALAFGNIDYGLDKLQNNTHGTYGEYLKEALPLTAFAGLGVGAKVLEPYLKTLGKNIELSANRSNAASRRLAETKNALNLGNSNSYNVKRFQDIDNLLKRLQGNGYSQLTREDIVNIMKSKKVSPEEADRLFKFWKTGEMSKPKVKAANKKTNKKQNKEQQNETSFDELNEELKKQNQEPDFTEQIFGKPKDKPSENMSKTNEKVSEGTNRPTEDKTLDNGHPTSPNDIEKVSDFLNKGIVSKELQNIIVKAKDLKNYCPDLLPFINKTPETNIKFVNGNKTNGYDSFSDTIELNVNIKRRNAIKHELQHAIDNIEVKNNPKDREIQIAQKASIYCNYMFNVFRENNKDLCIKITKKLKEYNGKSNLVIKDKELANNIELVKDYFRLYDNYKNTLLETRAQIAAEIGGVPNVQTIKQTISEFKRIAPDLWTQHKRFARECDKLGLSSTNRGRESLFQQNIKDIKNIAKDLSKQDKFNVVRDSKATEKILIETGIIEDKQALNRLKQQHKSGDGIYFQQYTMHDTDGINLARDYSKEREKKVGWFGKKIREGLRKKARTVDIVTANKLRRIKAENIKNTLDYLEQNFGVKTSSAPKQGNWKPVNKTLLANAMWGGTSKKWYELLSKDEAAIRAAFKDKKQADYWVNLHKRTRNTDFYVPEEIYNVLFDGRGEKLTEYWTRYKDAFGNNTKELSGVVLDIANNFFKRRVLGTPSFVLNNRMNQLLIAARSDSPADYIKSLFEAKNIKDYDLPAEVLENSIAEAVEQSTKRNVYTNNTKVDNFINLFGGHMIDLKTARGWKKLPALAADVAIGLPNAAYSKIADGLLNLNTKMEVFERKQVFAQQLNKVKRDLVEKTGQQMVTTEEAIKYVHKHPELKETIIRRIEDTLGDYNNFNRFERNVLKRVIPFYSWHRTMARHLVHLIKENPARCAMIYAELAKAADDDSALHKIFVDAHILKDDMKNADLKSYQKGAFRTPLKDKRSGKQLLINKVRQIPYNTPKEWMKENEAKGSIAPIFRVPAEAIRGKKFFNDSEITNRRYVRVQNPNYKEREKQPYKYFDTKTKKHLDNLPITTRLGYVGKEALRDAYPLIYNNALNLEGTFGAYRNLADNGKFLEYDKSYDASLGGFRHGDVIQKNYYKKKRKKGKDDNSLKRFASNNTSEETKLLNRLGLTLQPKQDLNKTEKEALKDRTKKYKEKHKKK